MDIGLSSKREFNSIQEIANWCLNFPHLCTEGKFKTFTGTYIYVDKNGNNHIKERYSMVMFSHLKMVMWLLENKFCLPGSKVGSYFFDDEKHILELREARQIADIVFNEIRKNAGQKIVESYNFERNQDPKHSMNIGYESQRKFNTLSEIINWCLLFPYTWSHGLVKNIEDAEVSYVTNRYGSKVKMVNEKISLFQIYIWLYKENFSLGNKSLSLKQCETVAYEVMSKIKLKIVKESLLETTYGFERGQNPKAAMTIGMIESMKKDLEEAGVPSDKYEFEPDGSIKRKGYFSNDWIFDNIELKYMPEDKKRFVEVIRYKSNQSQPTENQIENAVLQAFKDKLSKAEINKLLNRWASKDTGHYGTAFAAKHSRTKKEIEHDNEHNFYVFIGFDEMVPIKIKGKTVYDKRLGTEGIVKIDPYNVGQSQQIPMMKMRAGVQYASSNGNVYIVKIPKDLMDEDHYSSIPPHCYDIFDKYKRRL